LKRVVLSLLGLILLVALLLAWVLGSSAGSRLALKQVPGLTLQNFQGRLGGQWSADHLHWEQGGTQIDIDAPSLAWSPACLLRLTLCIDRLHTGDIAVQLPPSEAKTESAPVALPDLDVPLALQLGDVRIGSVHLDGSEQLSDLRLDARWTADGVVIDTLALQREQLSLALQGTLTPGGDWPLQASAQVQLPPVDGKAWQLDLQLNGNLARTLALSGVSRGYLDARLNGELQPLAEHLPAQLSLVSDAFKPGADLPDTLQLNQLQLAAKGDLQAGYRLDGSASLPAQQAPIALVLQGRVDSKGARIDTLALDAGPSRHLRLDGTVDWQQGLQADAKLDWLDFPWHRLYPVIDEPQVAIKRFNAELAWRDGHYLGNFAGAFDGPAGAFTLGSPFSGDLQQVALPQLALVAGQGKASGYLKLQFADGLAWDTALDLSAINPAYWLAELPGTLAGPLRSQGEMKQQRLQLDADLDLKGRLRGQPAVLAAKAQGQGEAWTLANLDIRLGDNHVRGSGSLQQRLAGQIDIDMPRLGQLWPQLQGQVKGRVDVAGTVQAPQGRMTLQGRQLALQDNRLQSLNLDAVLDAAQRATLTFAARGINAGDTDVGELTAKAQGTLKQQQLQVALQGPKLQAELAVDGTLAEGNWRGRLGSGRIAGAGQVWTLANAAALQRLASGEITLGAHCWRSGAASLCGDNSRLAPEPKLRYHLKQFPLQSLAQWFPKDFAWQGLLNADVQLDVPASGPVGQVTVDASNGTLRIRDQQQWQDFPYRALRLRSELGPRRIDTTLDFQGGRLGTLRVTSQINPVPANKPLSGEFSLQGLDLSVARPFVPMVETLAGMLNGNGTLSGGLMAPQVNGTLNLTGGEVSGGQLPTSLQDLRLQARIAGESVQLDGGWKSGKAGVGSITGSVDWGQALTADIRLKGTQLPVLVEPYAELEAAPDLRISMDGERLAVTGKMLVPKGAITVRELPPSTVKVSEDARIVGQQASEGKPSLPMAMDIDVQVGQEKLSFSGFGLTANLAGRVHIGDNLDTRGELNLNDGRYRAYGQRLTIRRARLLFAGPIGQPYLDIEAVRVTDDVVAGIRLTGNAEQPTTEVFSEPAMSQEQALSYLVLGRPLSTSGEDSNMLAQAALGLGLAGSSGVTSKLATDLGIEDFQLDTEGSGNATSVVASGNLSEKLSLRYGVGVFEPANTIALRYLLSKRLYLEVASGVASSLDLFYKRDF